MNSEQTERWRRCSSCKKDIAFCQIYWVCNVSTCNRKRTGTVFCTVSCCEAHVGIMRHRESWAVEKTSPTREAFRLEQAGTKPTSRPASRPPKRSIVRASSWGSEVSASGDPGSGLSGAGVEARSIGSPTKPSHDEVPREILIVASKLKSYIKAVSGMNTSEAVLEMLSDHVRALCDEAIRSAHEHERRTVMDRDYPKP